VREVLVGLTTDAGFEDAARAVSIALGELLEEREGLNVGGGGVYFSNFRLPLPDPEYQFIRNYSEYERERLYDDERDIRFVLRIEIDEADLDVNDLVDRLQSVGGEWRVFHDSENG
jgi:hypothetical protein